MTKKLYVHDKDWYTVHTGGKVKTSFGDIIIADGRLKPYKKDMIYHIRFDRTDDHAASCEVLRQLLGQPAEWTPSYRNHSNRWRGGRARGGLVRAHWADWYSSTKWARDKVYNVWLSDWDAVKMCTLHHVLAA